MSGDESFDTCMSLICNKNNEPVSHEWFDSETRFDAEAKDNLEIAYYYLHLCQYDLFVMLDTISDRQKKQVCLDS